MGDSLYYLDNHVCDTDKQQQNVNKAEFTLVNNDVTAFKNKPFCSPSNHVLSDQE